MANSIITGTFVVYLIGVMLIGVFANRITNTAEDYLLGGRGLNVFWATMSEQASVWSGWLTVGFPGMVYSSGLQGIWWFFWTVPGNILAWGTVAKRLSRYTRILKALTLPEFLGRRYGNNTKAVILVAAAGAAYFYFFYVGAQILAGANAIAGGLGFSFNAGFVITITIVLLYTMIGGFIAVSLTDVIQGILMMVFAIVVPMAAISHLGGFTATMTQFNEVGTAAQTSWTAGMQGPQLWLTIIAVAAFGIPFLAQPHGVTRYMSLEKPSQIGYGMLVMAAFATVALVGVPFLGIGGQIMYPNIENVDLIAPMLIQSLLPPWAAGILLAAIIAAVMSTADSQLLVVGSTIGEDVFRGIYNPDASERAALWVTRGAVAVSGIIAAYIAYTTPDTVFKAVAFAWGGLGTTFAPALVAALWWKRANGYGAIASMAVGFGGAAYYHFATGGPALAGKGLFDYYFVGPVLLAATITMIVVSLLTGEPKDGVESELTEISKPLTEEVDLARKEAGEVSVEGPSSSEIIPVKEEEVVTRYLTNFALTGLPTVAES